jgi:hypothetical protein
MKVSPVSESGEWRQERGDYNVAIDDLYQAYLEFIPRYLRDGSPMTIQLGNFFMCKKGARNYAIPYDLVGLKKSQASKKTVTEEDTWCVGPAYFCYVLYH